MYIRKQIFEKSGKESFFLWGARQTGKSTLLKNMYPESLWFDLLQTDVFERLYREPSQLREIVMASDHEVAIEVKSTDNAGKRHIKGLRYFEEEYNVKQSILVSNDPFPRKIGTISILPWKIFLQKLWNGELIK
ncbi:hypothetical protein [Anaerophaga thermohalophila]|uniref:hypothetical protein n=1 Tax=Anaerophaga thermohalophila TaxID=177400 RepID=UPI000237B95C|nr:hypothetical protein [Anaerophaga thermohalophila]